MGIFVDTVAGNCSTEAQACAGAIRENVNLRYLFYIY
jgi:hypothetical protein